MAKDIQGSLNDIAGTAGLAAQGAAAYIAAAVAAYNSSTQPAGTRTATTKLTTDSTPAVTNGVSTAVTGLSVAVSTTGPVRVCARAPQIAHSVSGSLIYLQILLDGTEVARQSITATTASANYSVDCVYEGTPTSGSHTWSVNVLSTTTGTVGIFANGGLSGPSISVYTS